MVVQFSTEYRNRGDKFEISENKKCFALQNFGLRDCNWNILCSGNHPFSTSICTFGNKGMLIFIVCDIAMLIYIFARLPVLLSMDITLGHIHCRNIARKKFILPQGFNAERVEKRLKLFGKECNSTAISPKPDVLRYKYQPSITVYQKCIEKVVAVYHVDSLDKSKYHKIFSSAITNSKALEGKRSPLFLDKSQKNAPIARITVIFIFAKQVDADLRENLYGIVCQNEGDGVNSVIIPCVVDAESGTAVFNCVKIPYIAYQYPSKNRGINIVKRYLFGGILPLKASPNRVDMPMDYDPKQSLWSFWRDTKKKMVTDQKEAKKRYGNMTHGEIIFEYDYLYVKWEDRGVWLFVEMDEDTMVAKVDPIHTWYYPKANTIAKSTVKEIKKRISVYFAEMGYVTEFEDYE